MRLVCVAHGTRSGEGNGVASALTAAAGARLGVEASVSYVELQQPSLAAALAASCEPAVVVPLLLSQGYHTRVDLPASSAVATGPVWTAPPLGPSLQLAAAQAARLLEAGASPGQPVVLVAAGSRDISAAVDVAAAADLLRGLWGGPVRVATVADGNVLDVVRPGDAVSPYLLAPGFFSRRVRELALSAGAAVVADVLGVHPTVVDLVVGRFLTSAEVRLSGSR